MTYVYVYMFICIYLDLHIGAETASNPKASMHQEGQAFLRRAKTTPGKDPRRDRRSEGLSLGFIMRVVL